MQVQSELSLVTGILLSEYLYRVLTFFSRVKALHINISLQLRLGTQHQSDEKRLVSAAGKWNLSMSNKLHFQLDGFQCFFSVVLNMFQKHSGWSSFSASRGNKKCGNKLIYKVFSMQMCTVCTFLPILCIINMVRLVYIMFDSHRAKQHQ